ncbi:hypothetical protein D3C76_1655730 [compost metagenome]
MIKVPICLATLAAVDRCAVLGDLFIAFTRERRPKLMKAFEVVAMEDVPRRTDCSLQNITVAFVWCNHVAAGHR